MVHIFRFIGVFSLTFLINKRRVNRISFKEQFIMAYGGLRGAVGFSLVTILPDDHPLKGPSICDVRTIRRGRGVPKSGCTGYEV